MSRDNNNKEFIVFNQTRSMIFVLLYVELFVCTLWLMPTSAGLIAAGLVFLTLPAVGFAKNLKQTVCDQIFDRIYLKERSVEYSSGMFGDNWDRPYNEFRVDCQTRNLLFFKLHNVRIKHRVLSNLLLKSTFAKDIADQKISELLNHSRLRFSKI